MIRRWLQAWLAQPKPEPTRSEVLEELQVTRRALKRFEAELDEAMTEHRALRARMTKILEAREKRPQEPPGTTNDPQQGVTPPPPSEDRWVALARARKQRQGAA